MTKESDSLKRILAALKKAYPHADCALDHRTPFQLLAATILSAQCTDERVNKVTPALFRRFPTPEAMAKARLGEVEALVRSTGFFRSKALALVTTAKALVGSHGGRVPRTMGELLRLRGVARKTANVVLGVCYGVAEGVVVDTHVRRLAFRMGFTREKDPVKIERDLMGIISKRDWIWVSHALITHGRGPCKAQFPRCSECSLEDICPKRGL